MYYTFPSRRRSRN